MAKKLPNSLPYVSGTCVSYKIDPAALTGIVDFRGVVLTGPATPADCATNKPCVNYPSAGTQFPIGIAIGGCDSPTSGDFPDASQNHVTVVHGDTFAIEVGIGETINVGERVDLDIEGKAVAAGTGVVVTTWVAKDESLATSLVGSPDYIRVILTAS